MNIRIFIAMITAVSGSFLQTPSDHFQVRFNSTFPTGNERLFRPIIIPNTTSEHPEPSGGEETHRINTDKEVFKKILQPEESTLKENYVDEEPRTVKFSSRYSTKQDDSTEKAQTDKLQEGTTQIPDYLESREDSRRVEDSPSTEIDRSFVSDSNDSEEENEDVREVDESEISPTTNEPYSELNRQTTLRNSDDFGSYETSPAEENEDESEDKRSVVDYYNSGSKNYHSIQTPLNKIKYRGPHSYDYDDFESERTRTRLIPPINRRPTSHNWPYSRVKINTDIEKLNEISDSDETYEKTLDEGITEEVKTKPKQLELESAVEKDEFKFDKNKKYNYIEERNRRNQKQKALIAEEEKDDRKPLFQSLKQYQVDEKQPKYQPRGSQKVSEGTWSTKPPQITTHKASKSKAPKKFTDLTPNFQGHQFLGPVVFSQNTEQRRTKPIAKNVQPHKQPNRGLSKGLLLSEKHDQDNLSNQRFQKSIFGTGSKITQSFNHVEESNEMYNAILANIQSVFGTRTQPLTSGGKKENGGSPTEAGLDESKSLTWSLPSKRVGVN